MKIAYKKNKLLQLRGFCAVIEEGSVLKASKKMNTAQSNVSLQIASLERDLKVNLFKREKQRLIATPEALRLYRVAKKSIEDIDMIFDSTMQAISTDYDNTIKLAGHSYMLSHVLPPYYKKMIEVNPDVKFDIWNSGIEEAMDMLNNGIVDIAIYPASNDFKMKNIEIRDFYKCEFGVVMSKNHPLNSINEKEITWDILSKHDYITIGKGITTQGLKSNIETHGIKSRFNLRNGTWEICIGIIKEGLTISGADTGYFKWHDDVAYKTCQSLAPEYQFHILVNNKANISKACMDFLKTLGWN
jgi:DNA-binding transcriptional LysR family regulator